MRKVSSELAIGIIGILTVFFAGIFVLIGMQNVSQPPIDNGGPFGNQSPVGCTQEALMCPDGVTYVGRTGPKCEFSGCPDTVSIPSRPVPTTSCDCIVGNKDCPCHPEPPIGSGGLCIDRCGDGICQEVVCQGSGCPCSETAIPSESSFCPQDCGGDDPMPLSTFER
jgi:hypothetical protein